MIEGSNLLVKGRFMNYKHSNQNIFLGIDAIKVIEAEFEIVENEPPRKNILLKIKDSWLWIKQRVQGN